MGILKHKHSSSTSYSDKSRFGAYLRHNKRYFEQNPSVFAEEYKKKPKKPKKLTRLIVNTLVICSVFILVVVASSVSIALVGNDNSHYTSIAQENVHNFKSLAVKPKFTHGIINLDNFESPSEKAQFLYELCSENSKNTEFFTAYNNGLLLMNMGSSNNYIDIDSVIMKTQTEYFSIIYHIKNSVPILDSILGGIIEKTADVVTTERMYAKSTDKKMAYQKVKNNSRDENGVPHADWKPLLELTDSISYKALPVFNSSQSGPYEITKHKISTETILTAEVSYNNTEGYYTVKATLDPTNPKTVVDSIADIRVGTGDKNAHYTLITTEFTVWDNGYLRSFNLTEKWEANVVISLAFELKTNWMCSYNSQDCNLNSYPDASATKKALGI